MHKISVAIKRPQWHITKVSLNKKIKLSLYKISKKRENPICQKNVKGRRVVATRANSAPAKVQKSLFTGEKPLRHFSSEIRSHVNRCSESWEALGRVYSDCSSASRNHRRSGICRKAWLRKDLKCLAMLPLAAGFISSMISLAFSFRKWFIASPEKPNNYLIWIICQK